MISGSFATSAMITAAQDASQKTQTLLTTSTAPSALHNTRTLLDIVKPLTYVPK